MKANEIIKRIAKANGLTPEQVETEMRSAIQEAMATKNPHAQSLWKQIAPDGKEPSIDRFLEFCADRLNKENNS